MQRRPMLTNAVHLRPLWEVLARDTLAGSSLGTPHDAYSIPSPAFKLWSLDYSTRGFTSAPPPPPSPSTYPLSQQASSFAAGGTYSRPHPNSSSTTLLGGNIPGTLAELTSEMQMALSAQRFQDVVSMLRRADRLLSSACRNEPVAAATAYDCALKACAAAGAADDALQLVGAMWRRNVPVGRVAHGSLLKALCEAGRREEALKRLKSISSKRVTPVMVNTVLGACAVAHDAAVGLRAWELVKRKGLPLDAVTWCEVMRLQGCAGDAAAVEATWEKALNSVHADEEGQRSMLYAARAAGLATAGDFPAAIAACESFMDSLSHLLPVPLEIPNDAENSSTNSNAHGGVRTNDGGNFKRGSNNKNTARREATPLQHLRSACNSVLHEAERRLEVSIMRRLVHLMTSRGLTPDTITYNALLRGAMRRGDGPVALREGVHEMAALGLCPNAATHSLLMEAHAAEGDVRGTQEAFQEMVSTGAEPDAAAWAALLKAYGRAGDLPGLASAYDDMVERRELEHADLSSIYQSAFTALRTAAAPLRSKSRHSGGGAGADASLRLAGALLKRMEADAHDLGRGGGALPPTTLSALLLAHGFMGHSDAVVRLIKEHFGSPRILGAGASTNSSSSSSSTATGASKDNKGEESGAVGSVAGSASSVTTLPSSASSPSQKSHLKSLEPLLIGALEFPSPGRQHAAAEVASCRSTPDLRTMNVALTSLGRHCGRLDLCVGVVRRLKELGMTPDAGTYSSLIAACAFPPRPHLARHLLDHAESSGIALSAHVFNVFMHVQCACLGVDAADSVLNEMEDRGIAPDAFTWMTMRAAALQQGRQDVAEGADLRFRNLQGGVGVGVEGLAVNGLSSDGGGAGDVLPVEVFESVVAAVTEAGVLEGQEAGHQNVAVRNSHKEEKHWSGYYATDEEDEW